jgi:hypothetical protein
VTQSASVQRNKQEQAHDDRRHVELIATQSSTSQGSTAQRITVQRTHPPSVESQPSPVARRGTNQRRQVVVLWALGQRHNQVLTGTEAKKGWLERGVRCSLETVQQQVFN